MQAACWRERRRSRGERAARDRRRTSREIGSGPLIGLLKWPHSLYRPTLPAGIRGGCRPPLSRPAIGASPSGKAVDFDSTIRRFESSRPSQPVRCPETLPSTMLQRPANGGLLRIGYQSPGSEIGVSGSEIADSLRRIFEIFPFSGDWRPETGFDMHCMAGLTVQTRQILRLCCWEIGNSEPALGAEVGGYLSTDKLSSESLSASCPFLRLVAPAVLRKSCLATGDDSPPPRRHL